VREKWEEIGSYNSISIQKALTASSTSERNRKAKEKAITEKKKLTVDPTTPILSKVAEENIFCPGCDEEFEEPITEAWVQCKDYQQWWHHAYYEETGVFKCDSY
jgi:hypothetical protein